jgi:hypothetical protein
MSTINDRIRSRAHQIWEEEGCPEGRAEEHWEKARILVAIEDDRTSLVPVTETTAGEPVEEASLQQNLGEFPAGRTDQGERAPTPLPASGQAPSPQPLGAPGKRR